MHFSSLQKFQNFLILSKLIDESQLQACLTRIGSSERSIEGLIRDLGSRNDLTPYQVSKLNKHQTDGLRLGPYKLLYRNASGSFARVFRGCSVVDGRMIGIKVLRQRWAEDPRKVSLFRREGELGKRLKHRNIVPIYEVGSERDFHYLSMEFIEGGNFRELLKSRGKFAVEEASQYVLDMAEGLDYALSLGVTHRDLKLTNVLLSSQGVAKLVDFGLAGMDSGLSMQEEEIDRAIEYATLERCTNAPHNDPRSDLYFLGTIFYELLTNVAPYPPSTRREDRKQPARYRNLRPIRQVDHSLPSDVMAVVDRLLEINPNDRFQSPSEVIRALRNIIRTEAKSQEVQNSDAIACEIKNEKPLQPTVICVENRTKHQDSLREYFSFHGYRVLLLGDIHRAIERIQIDPPQGLVVMADSLGDGDQASKAYAKTADCCQKSGTPVILVLSKKYLSIRKQFADTPSSRILAENYVTLRSIRTNLEEMQSVFGGERTYKNQLDSQSTD
jgi:serine/threonine protein kinase